MISVSFFFGIVNALCPGTIRTPIFETGEGISAQQAEEFFESFKNLYPVGRVGTGADTSAAIEYLISDSASFITGSNKRKLFKH